MSAYGNYADSPDQITKEGQDITVKFKRVGDGTGVISWNIPNPVAGCSTTNQAYDGIVITVASKPSNYISTSPKDSVYYNGDVTLDLDLNAGDSLDYAKVLGAFYHDKETTSLIVTDVKDKTPYYISAYAVDAVGRYHREGVHAYSLPTGEHELNAGESQKPAYHDILIDLPIGEIFNVNMETGLNTGQMYTFTVKYNNKKYDFSIDGSDAITYAQLIDTLNKRFFELEEFDSGVSYPNTGTYFYNDVTHKLKLWDGESYSDIEFIPSANDPSFPIIDTYWFNDETVTLNLYTIDGWVEQDLIVSKYDPTNPACGALWFDGVTVYKWDGTIWLQMDTYITNRNPLLPPELSCNWYWYDTASSEFFNWSEKYKRWESVDVIYSHKDLENITNNDYWYSNVTEKASVFNGVDWNQLVNIRYEERNSEGNLDTPAPLHYWFIPSEQALYRRDSANTMWVLLNVIISDNDPTNRVSGQLWWDSVNDILYKWDTQSNNWLEMIDFFQTDTDPAKPPKVSENSAWYNPDTNNVTVLLNSECVDKDFISYPSNPMQPDNGDLWYNPTTKLLYEWNDIEWDSVQPIVDDNDPFFVAEDVLWLDTTDTRLYVWGGGDGWLPLTLSLVDVTPAKGTLWFNTPLDSLKMWNGIEWEDAKSLIFVHLVEPNEATRRARLRFETRATGCDQHIEVLSNKETIISQLTNTVLYGIPERGASALLGAPMYTQLGVGTDGSPDERRAMHESIRTMLGYPSVQVELTKRQLDECIDNGLLVLRKKSSFGYRRGFFFLDVRPNQQIYVMTNKCVGFNKIVKVNDAHRMRAGFMRGAYGGVDIFGYAALKQMYTLGTFDLLSFHLVSSYIEELRKMFADHLTFKFDENTRELSFYHRFYVNERILLDAYIERTEQDILNDREVKSWLKRWCVAEAKMMLSQVRGKFQVLPGPNGSTTLNAQEMITQSENERAELLQEIEDLSMQNLTEVGLGAHFVLG